MKGFNGAGLAFCSILLVSSIFAGTKVRGAETDEIYINRDTVNVRQGPGPDFPIVEKASKGDSFSILKKEGDWLQIKTDTGEEGWVAGWVIDGSIETNSNTVSNKTGVITASFINVRTEPSFNSGVLGKLTQYSQINILSSEGDWVKIQFKQSTGWLHKKYINFKKPREVNIKPGVKATVTAYELTVRSEPEFSGSLIGTVNKGQIFTILEARNNWAKIRFTDNQEGWIAGWYLEQSPEYDTARNSNQIEILHNGTNIRSEPSVNSRIVSKTHPGQKYEVVGVENDWYQIKLYSGKTAFVAGWVVSAGDEVPQIKRQGTEQFLSDKMIVLDPGHGGRDKGTIGFSGTLEKTLTLQTALLLKAKLENAGARVILTRNEDHYISLPGRVQTSHYYNADAFISLHYDSAKNNSADGITTYFYHSYQQKLAESVHSALRSTIQVNDRGYRFGNYHVTRENKHAAVLVELGYLSNPAEELRVTSIQYQEAVSNAIFSGLVHYFK
jgi:N-acetylmuramoyl-L-alanine amidase